MKGLKAHLCHLRCPGSIALAAVAISASVGHTCHGLSELRSISCKLRRVSIRAETLDRAVESGISCLRNAVFPKYWSAPTAALLSANTETIAARWLQPIPHIAIRIISLDVPAQIRWQHPRSTQLRSCTECTAIHPRRPSPSSVVLSIFKNIVIIITVPPHGFAFAFDTSPLI